ncbi:hypothetical protein RchiOBHm_Chr6g0261031 [Rosa chinensis]|uniref:Uncharacterized protein n=1 Tax=Rosa chinensis TaxID=74649 RepID=A0A2P6PNA2_ROSCH|nr:hypothetical protein RchiOBHm_Chr6g0261031 [Rosa chinensis]
MPHKLLRILENLRILCGEGLISEDHFPLFDLKCCIMAMDHDILLGLPVLERNRRFNPQSLINHGLGQIHLIQRRESNIPIVFFNKGPDFISELAVQILSCGSNPLD